MMQKRTYLPPTIRKVNMNTSDYINQAIQQDIEENINKYKGKSTAEIKERLHQLSHEWDTERVLELNLSIIVLLSSILGISHSKKWFFLSTFASAFMIQHSLQGWCPPLPVIRRLKVRTSAEIDQERTGLQQLLVGN